MATIVRTDNAMSPVKSKTDMKHMAFEVTNDSIVLIMIPIVISIAVQESEIITTFPTVDGALKFNL